MIEINLLPGAQGKSKRGGPSVNFSAVASSIGSRITDKYLLGAGATMLVGLGAILGMFLFQQHQRTVADERQRAAASDSVRFAAVLIARSKAETTRDSVYQQLAIIKSIDDTRFTWPHLLEEINLALPSYTWLTGVSQTSPVTTTAGAESDPAAAARAKADSAKHGGSKAALAALVAKRRRAHADSLYKGEGTSTKIRIVGQTVDIQALTLFMKNLEASPFIKNVQLTRSDLVTSDNKEVTEFQLEAETETPLPSMIETIPLAVAVR